MQTCRNQSFKHILKFLTLLNLISFFLKFKFKIFITVSFFLFVIATTNRNLFSQSRIDSLGYKQGFLNSLEPSIPNPVTSTAKIFYTLSKESKIDLKIYDMFYKEVYNTFTGNQKSGRFEFVLNIEKSFTSGMYIMMLKTDEEVITQRIVVIK